MKRQNDSEHFQEMQIIADISTSFFVVPLLNCCCWFLSIFLLDQFNFSLCRSLVPCYLSLTSVNFLNSGCKFLCKVRTRLQLRRLGGCRDQLCGGSPGPGRMLDYVLFYHEVALTILILPLLSFFLCNLIPCFCLFLYFPTRIWHLHTCNFNFI